MPMPRRRRLPWVVVVLCGAYGSALVGCREAAAPEQLTFNRDVAPIVFARCATCHRPGEAAPFSLLSYDDVRSRASQIVEVTQSRFMPPWLPEAGHGQFLGERRLTDRELAVLKDWAAAGGPEGEAADLPPVPQFTPGWQLDEPDLVLESPPYEVASSGADVFRNFVLAVPGDQSRWVRAIELRPENPRVTHHARIGVDSTNESVRRDAEDEAPGYPGMAWGQDPDGQLVTWTPGMLADPGTPGVAWRLRPGNILVLHTHMQPSGKPETVQFRVGLHYAEGPPQERPLILRVGSRAIDIPAGASRLAITDEFQLPIDVDVQFVFPHAHSLCQGIHVVAQLPDGSEQTIISIPAFDENWHDKYRFAKPPRLPAGAKLISTFTYDNSADNVRNPHDPPQRVAYGSNADDEMSDVYLQVTPVDPRRREVLLEDYNQCELDSKITGYLKNLELHPDDPWSREGLASCYVAKKQANRAIQLLEARQDPDAESVHSLVILGMAFLANGEHLSARDLLRRALDQDPLYPIAWLGLGQALVAGNDLVEAEKALRRAVELAPGLTVANLDLADLMVGQGRLDDAAAACEAALAAAPDEAKPYLKLAEIRAAEQRYDESLELLQSAREIAPYTYAPKVSLAVYCYQNGEEDRPRTLLEEAVQQSPDDPVAHLYLGQIARRDQRLARARQHLDQAATLPIPVTWPDSHRRQFLTLVHLERFQLAQQLEDIDLAREVVADWLEVDPNNAKLREIEDRLLRTAPGH